MGDHEERPPAGAALGAPGKSGAAGKPKPPPRADAPEETRAAQGLKPRRRLRPAARLGQLLLPDAPWQPAGGAFPPGWPPGAEGGLLGRAPHSWPGQRGAQRRSRRGGGSNGLGRGFPASRPRGESLAFRRKEELGSSGLRASGRNSERAVGFQGQEGRSGVWNRRLCRCQDGLWAAFAWRKDPRAEDGTDSPLQRAHRRLPATPAPQGCLKVAAGAKCRWAQEEAEVLGCPP